MTHDQKWEAGDVVGGLMAAGAFVWAVNEGHWWLVGGLVIGGGLSYINAQKRKSLAYPDDVGP